MYVPRSSRNPQSEVEATHGTLMETAARGVCGSGSKMFIFLNMFMENLFLSPEKKEKRKVLISPSSEFPLSTSDYPAPSSSLADYESLQLYRLSSNFLMSQRHTALE